MVSIEKVRAQQRAATARYRATKKGKATEAAYRKSAKRKAVLAKYDKAARKRNQAKFKARSVVNNAKRDGKIKPAPCANCGKKKTQAHHTDYTKPLEVVWLCAKCHTFAHAAIR